MRRRRAWSVAQARVTLAVLLSCLLVAMPLGGSTFVVPELTAISLVVLALASVLASAPRLLAMLPVFMCVPVGGEGVPPVLRTRQTDPTHHPLAPRAPGRV